MLETITSVNQTVNTFIWGVPMMVLLMGVGVLLTILTKGIQFRKLPFAFQEVLGKLFRASEGEGTVRPFQALATALASTVGVGNIAGVSTAIFLGGPGALFWLMVSGLLGMSTKFAEIAIALNYRERDAGGTMRGGAMYVLKKGLRMPWLGAVFALLTAVAGFGLGNMVQANSVADAMRASFGVAPWISGLFLVALTAMVVLGGIRRIAEVTQFLVPFMCLLYLAGGLIVLARYAGAVPEVIRLILESAFTGQAAVGGFAGATARSALSYGIKRGLFSNEAGLGSAPMVHSSAVTDHPIRQASYGIFEVFVGLRFLHDHRLGLLWRDGDHVPVRGQSDPSLPAGLDGLRLLGRYREPPPDLGCRRHAERPDGHPEPDRRARLAGRAAAADPGILRRPQRPKHGVVPAAPVTHSAPAGPLVTAAAAGSRRKPRATGCGRG